MVYVYCPDGLIDVISGNLLIFEDFDLYLSFRDEIKTTYKMKIDIIEYDHLEAFFRAKEDQFLSLICYINDMGHSIDRIILDYFNY